RNRNAPRRNAILDYVTKQAAACRRMCVWQSDGSSVQPGKVIKPHSTISGSIMHLWRRQRTPEPRARPRPKYPTKDWPADSSPEQIHLWRRGKLLQSLTIPFAASGLAHIAFRRQFRSFEIAQDLLRALKDRFRHSRKARDLDAIALICATLDN